MEHHAAGVTPPEALGSRPSPSAPGGAANKVPAVDAGCIAFASPFARFCLMGADWPGSTLLGFRRSPIALLTHAHRHASDTCRPRLERVRAVVLQSSMGPLTSPSPLP